MTFPGLLFQHPTTPVQNAMKTAKNATMNNATVDRAMCNLKTSNQDLVLLYKINQLKPLKNYHIHLDMVSSVNSLVSLFSSGMK